VGGGVPISEQKLILKHTHTKTRDEVFVVDGKSSQQEEKKKKRKDPFDGEAKVSIEIKTQSKHEAKKERKKMEKV